MHDITIRIVPAKELLSVMDKISRRKYRMGVLALAGVAYAIWSDSKRRDLEKRVNDLATQIDILAEEE